MKEIKSIIIKTIEIPWKDMNWLQPRNFKKAERINLEKLKNSLITNGFSLPFNVWEDNKGKIWILDGHHREKVMKELLVEGVIIPNVKTKTL